MTENQKLRKELQAAIVLFGHKCHDDCTKLTWLERAEQALALPTADHIPDAGKMIETAAPVGEREAFESVIVDQCGSGAIKRWPNGRGESYENARVQDYRQGWLWCIEWQARAALSAGDAVDAQRTPQPHAVITGKLGTLCSFNSSELRKGDPIYTAAQIDAAMRKGQL